MKRFIPIVVIISLISAMFVFSNAGAASYKLGDVNLDGNVLASDARSILRYSARLETGYTELQQLLADVDGKNGINAADARLALRTSAKLDPEVTIEYGEESSEPDSEPVSVPYEGEVPFDQLPRPVRALLEGKFGIEGKMIVGSGEYAETFDANMYTDGTNIKMSVDGQEFGMEGMLTLIVKEESVLFGLTTTRHMYMLNDTSKTYFEIDETSMKLIGFDMDDMDLSFDLSELSGGTGVSAVLTHETVDGRDYDVYSFENEEVGAVTKMYMYGDDLVAFELYDDEEYLDSRYEIDKFVAYPGESAFAVPDGYEKQGILQFFGDYI